MGQVAGFYYLTCRQARVQDLTSWVRNLAGGKVEAVFERQESVIRQAMDGFRQGPDGGRVDEMEIDWEEYRGEFDGFGIRV